MDMGGAKMKAVKKVSKKAPAKKKVNMRDLWVVCGIIVAMCIMTAVVTW